MSEDLSSSYRAIQRHRKKTQMLWNKRCVISTLEWMTWRKPMWLVWCTTKPWVVQNNLNIVVNQIKKANGAQPAQSRLVGASQDFPKAQMPGYHGMNREFKNSKVMFTNWHLHRMVWDSSRMKLLFRAVSVHWNKGLQISSTQMIWITLWMKLISKWKRLKSESLPICKISKMKRILRLLKRWNRSNTGSEPLSKMNYVLLKHQGDPKLLNPLPFLTMEFSIQARWRVL